ncbi:MAG: HAMP domain-containing protein [Myxococcota bacterium]|nr:HAMP domain-containing protein [Myxococcota bacterium]
MTSKLPFVRRLQLGLGALVGLSLLALAVVLATEQRAGSALAGSQTALDLLHDLQQVQIRLSAARAAEREFLLEDLRAPSFFQTGESEALERHAEALAALESLLDGLEQAPSAADLGIDGIRTEAAGYRASFLELVDLYRERGSLYSGVLGDMRRATFELQELIEPLAAAHEATLRAELLELTRDQDDYLRNLDIRPRYLVGERIEILREEAAPTPSAARTEIEQRIEVYEVAWRRLLEIDERIGITSGAGLRGRLRSAEDAVELGVETSVAVARERFDAATSVLARTAAQARRVSAGAAVLTLVIALAVAVSLARHLRGSLQELLRAVEDYAGGNRAARVGPLPRRDEFAAVAEAFDRMAETLAETTDELEEINASLELAVKGDSQALLERIKELVAERKSPAATGNQTGRP